MDSGEKYLLEKRLGQAYARQRLGVEQDHEAQVFGQGLTFFHLENSVLSALAIEYALKLTGLYWRGRRNASRVQVLRNSITVEILPNAFDGFTILQLSDLHCDMSMPAMQQVAELLQDLTYDICVLTGDYRGATVGPFEAALAAIGELRAAVWSR